LSIIAEIKRASPSRGPILEDLDPSTLASLYERGGAAVVSVLTEERHFLGSLDDLRAVRSSIDLPVLRKDFILEAAQVWEARAAGADAVLLIVAVLDDPILRQLIEQTRELGMEALVEAHNAGEVDRALAAGARVVGVNNRDLETFEVDLATAENLADRVGGVVSVAESGIWSAADARRMQASGFDAVLVGESLVRAKDPIRLMKDLKGMT
jgi:indole-3-glycerol phosphate synthase